jgi:hypothetical protein
LPPSFETRGFAALLRMRTENSDGVSATLPSVLRKEIMGTTRTPTEEF